jgi:hypothetical protein
MSHSFIARRVRVDSRLLVVGSQTASLTPGPSFAHNLGCRCPNDSCKSILDIYTSRPFQWYQEHPNERCFDPWNQALSFWESRNTPSPQLWECEFHPHTWPKWGCNIWSFINPHLLTRSTTNVMSWIKRCEQPMHMQNDYHLDVDHNLTMWRWVVLTLYIMLVDMQVC